MRLIHKRNEQLVPLLLYMFVFIVLNFYCGMVHVFVPCILWYSMTLFPEELNY